MVIYRNGVDIEAIILYNLTSNKKNEISRLNKIEEMDLDC